MNEELINKISDGPYEWAVIPEGQDQMEIVRKHFEFGSGDIHAVWLPSHPKSVIGTDRERPEHGVFLCMTGNGPNSENNAKALCALLMQRDIIKTDRPRLPIPTTPEAVAWAQYAMGLEHALGIADVMSDETRERLTKRFRVEVLA